MRSRNVSFWSQKIRRTEFMMIFLDFVQIAWHPFCQTSLTLQFKLQFLILFPQQIYLGFRRAFNSVTSMTPKQFVYFRHWQIYVIFFISQYEFTTLDRFKVRFHCAFIITFFVHDFIDFSILFFFILSEFKLVIIFLTRLLFWNSKLK